MGLRDVQTFRILRPQVLLLSKCKAPINHAESTLLEVFILKQLKGTLESTLFKKQGGVPHYGQPNVIREYLVSRPGRTNTPVRWLDLFPLSATLTKTPGMWGYSSHFGTCRRLDVSTCRRPRSAHCWLCFRAASNSSPGIQPASVGCQAAFDPRTKPNLAMTASPVKSMSGLYSSLGWW
jgi:hypothetical protein